ncbi:acyl-CoA dehydrogenase [Mycobacterium saskatchewanense]|uniref:Acyl-CoA dehydrogenase n=2 Tax=Mycobacterium saskatchewanense TaxID=220927 RepID=A0AAJ3TTH7_9MYCO|nr:acyl-CoA dehydrogenase family protein [Mycobacterium saskatchewanense]ORW68097.1 hypothetical protein AWC23_21960 [Mycobacterium saskatchewanense]BBX66455.1 acyl-CoA dehydrogenase [Mycobacterium saskatchewanense]
MQLQTPEQDELRSTSRKVLLRNATSERIREVSSTAAGHDAEFWNQIAEMGWLALTVPEDNDGLGLGLPELAILGEEFGYSLQPSPFLAHSLVTWMIAQRGSENLQVRLVPSLAGGDAVASWALPQPGDAETLVLRDGRLNGTRRLVPYANCADHLLVEASADGQPLLVVVDVAAAGTALRVTDQHTIDLTRPYARVDFDAVPVEADAVISLTAAPSELWRAAVALQCAESVGVTRRLVQMTVSYVNTRHQFDRPIGSFQAIKHHIADMHIQLEGAAAATEESVWAIHRRRSDAAVAAHVAKSWTGRAASWVASEALQLHGGIGFTWEHDLHLYLRRAKVNELLLGAPAWHDERIFDTLVAGIA